MTPLVNRQIMATSPTGGSLDQLNRRGQQAGSFMAAQAVTASNQAAAGLGDATALFRQAQNTEANRAAAADLNFRPSPPEDAVRNAAQQLNLSYRTGLAKFHPEMNGAPAMTQLAHWARQRGLV
jgi:hypothetical protein